jgi:hypothetical protein
VSIKLESSVGDSLDCLAVYFSFFFSLKIGFGKLFKVYGSSIFLLSDGKSRSFDNSCSLL